MAWSAGRAAAKASAVPDAITVNWPSAARTGAAADRGVEVAPARGFEPRAKSARDLRVHGRGRDEHGALLQGLARAPGPEQHRLGLAALTTTEITTSRAFGRQRGGPRHQPAFLAELLQRRGGHVAAPPTSKPLRRSDWAMPKPIEPRPITATRRGSDMDGLSWRCATPRRLAASGRRANYTVKVNYGWRSARSARLHYRSGRAPES